jgi:hypothetical protein
VKRLVILAAVSALVLIGCSDELPTDSEDAGNATDEAALDDGGEVELIATHPHFGIGKSTRTYEIIVENLTPATGTGASQPFSPPVLATHHRKMNVFRPGSYASDELAQVAEDAVNGPLVDLLQNSSRVFDVVEGGGVILPGGEGRYEIQASWWKRRLSVVFMLVNTNDGFGGLDAVRLPSHGEEVYYVRAYDAGSELNTESASDIPGPCCGSPGQGTATHDVITDHAGILGGGDLDPDVYGWSEPVAKVTIRRINPTYEITLENLTPSTVPGGSQVFSPPVLATHNPRVRMFRVGHFATDEMSRIAEDGDTGPMVTALEGSGKTLSIVTGAGPVLPGASATYQVEAAPGYGRLSMAFMLVNTNDAFSGVDKLWLPRGGSASYYLRSWDAGSEQNTELASDIPGPCCGSPGQGPDEHRRIWRHAGILGVGDLSPADYGWGEPVAKLTITRVK